MSYLDYSISLKEFFRGSLRHAFAAGIEYEIYKQRSHDIERVEHNEGSYEYVLGIIEREADEVEKRLDDLMRFRWESEHSESGMKDRILEIGDDLADAVTRRIDSWVPDLEGH